MEIFFKAFELFLETLEKSQIKKQQNNKYKKNSKSSTKYLFESWKIRRLFEAWKDRNFYNTEEGCQQSAKYLMAKLLELSDNSGYSYGKAIAHLGLGAITSQEGEKNTALDYLNQSIEILEDIHSEDAVEVRRCINKLMT